MIFGRRKEQDPAQPDPLAGNPYLGLRQGFLDLDAELVDAPLRGVALELGTAGGVATLICVADGTTSFYLSTGGGFIGAGAHESVRTANAAFCGAVSQQLDLLLPVADVPLPTQGEINVVAVTDQGPRLLRDLERNAQESTSPSHPLYVAGQDVITQIRLTSGEQGR